MIKGITVLKQSVKPKGYLTISEFAKVVNRSRGLVYKGIKEGKLIKGQFCYWQKAKGKQKVIVIKKDAADYFLNGYRPKISTPEKSSASKDIKDLKKGSVVHSSDYLEKVSDLAEIKAHREKLHAYRQELELKKARNELITVERVEKLFGDMAIQIRQSLLALVPRVVPIMTAETDIHVNMSTLENEIESVLTNIIKMEDVING